MTIRLERRGRRRRIDRQSLADTELPRLWILSLPPGYRLYPPNGER
jgi:hypothetical protein